jgi:hypothetical protein
MSWKYKNKRREIQENLSNDSYVFLSYYISNAKHIHSISGGQVTRAKCLHGGGELPGNDEILAIIETYSNPDLLFTWCSQVTHFDKFPAERNGLSPRRDN